MSIRQLAPELAQIAKKELNEDSKRLAEDIRNLKEWISKQPHLIARTDDQWLVSFLRGCKYSLETVKKKFDLFYTLRTTASNITRRFSTIDDKFLEVVRIGACVILPQSNASTPRVVLFKLGLLNAETFQIIDLLAVFYYLLQILVLEDDAVTVVGLKVLVDYEGFGMGLIGQINISLIKKIIVIIQDSMPLRLKGSHHINLPSSLETVMSLVKSLINEKAKERLTMHKNKTEILSVFGEKSVPKEYGGLAGTIKDIAESWAQKCIEYKSWMQQEHKLGTDETKRLGQPKSAEAMFGVEGSFRKFEID